MDRVLAKAAGLHHQQLSWRTPFRIAWWLFLLPLALACWTANQRAAPLKVIGWAAVAVAMVFWAAGIATAVNPPPPTSTRTAVAAKSSPPTSDATPASTFSVLPDLTVHVTSPPTSLPPSLDPPTLPVPVAPPSPVAAAVAPPVIAPTPPAPVRTTAPQPTATHTTTVPPPAAPSCTLTGTGKCIKGGELCPVAKEGQAGYDASGTRYVCTDSDHDGHPHWK